MSLPNAFVTLLTTPSYLPGALVLLHSLHELHPAPRDFKIVCLVTPETVDVKTIGSLRQAGYDLVIGVEPIGSGTLGQSDLQLMGRPDLNLALTKLHLFRLSPLFSTLIYLDADVLPLRPLDHLFAVTNPHILSACPDTGWPDCFNSGVMVIRPREKDWEGLRELLQDGEGEAGGESRTGNGSFDGADQGLLNEYFSEGGGGGEWNRLPFLYNVTPSAAYQWAPAYKRYGSKINAVQFIGSNKPWGNLAGRPAGYSQTKGEGASYDYPALIDKWYTIYDKHVRPTSAHAPDLASRFAIPETIAVWNRSGVPQQPDDRLDLAQLREAVDSGVTSLKPGQYLSLPVDGRVDLIMPKPRRPASPPTIRTPSPQIAQPQQPHPQSATWDASRYSPPKSTGPEMTITMDTNYQPAWNAPPAQQSQYHQHNEPQYPTLPANVQGDEWYKRFTNSQPDSTQVGAVFPWEKSGQTHRRQPDRVFPRGDTPPPDQTQSQSKHRQTPSVSQQSPTPPTQQSMSEAMSTYTNAWDSMPSIQRYVSRITAHSRPTSISLPGSLSKDQIAKGLMSVPGTPKIDAGLNLHVRETSLDRRSDASGDGDDEGEGNEDEEESSDSEGRSGKGVRTFSGSSGGTVGWSESGNGTPRFRDRFTQTDGKVGTSDQKVQAVPGGGPSPVTKTFEINKASTHTHNTRPSLPVPGSKPKPLRRTSSSDTARPVVTPSVSTSGSENVGMGSGGKKGVAGGLPGVFEGTGTSSGEGEGGKDRVQPSRIFDPSTDIDVRKRDTQEVLSRFMKAGSFGRGGK